MSRSGYSDECNGTWGYICWRGAVNSAINGARGQVFLKELAAIMDATPEEQRRLIPGHMEMGGEFCAMGLVAHAREVKIENQWDTEEAAHKLNIANAMAREIAYENDEGTYNYHNETPEQRWQRMRRWVDDQLSKEKKDGDEKILA